MMATVIVPMAGFGTRFQTAGYRVPKYRVEVAGRTLFSWSMLSLDRFRQAGAHFAFVMRRDDAAVPFLREECRRQGMHHVGWRELEAPTDGQATTALLAKPLVVDPSAPVLIYNIDTFVEPETLSPADIRGEGWIPCFRAAGEGWSFVRIDETGRALEVREKKRVSPHASIGLYYFSSFELFEDAYGRHYSSVANMEMGERYVAPIYNTMIAAGHDVYHHDLPLHGVHPLGTPEDVERFRHCGRGVDVDSRHA